MSYKIRTVSFFYPNGMHDIFTIGVNDVEQISQINVSSSMPQFLIECRVRNYLIFSNNAKIIYE